MGEPAVAKFQNMTSTVDRGQALEAARAIVARGKEVSLGVLANEADGGSVDELLWFLACTALGYDELLRELLDGTGRLIVVAKEVLDGNAR